MKRSFIIELFVISLLGCVYFALHTPSLAAADYSPPLLDLQSIPGLLTNTSVRPVGLEHERLAGTILPIRIGLQRYDHIPTWNSFLSNGVPLTNNAFSYFFNPFHSLPVLVLGDIECNCHILRIHSHICDSFRINVCKDYRRIGLADVVQQ
ncbi:MAG: hypothetical protein ABI970_16335 [Chloroflexota bacterium]